MGNVLMIFLIFIVLLVMVPIAIGMGCYAWYILYEFIKELFRR